MKTSFYKSHNGDFFQSKKCIAVVELRNHFGVMPKNTKFTILEKNRGFSLMSDKCPCCGTSFLIKQVPPEKIEIIED